VTRLHQQLPYTIAATIVIKSRIKSRIPPWHEHLDYVEHYASSWMAYDSNVVAVCPARLR
jgi:hypothetical protein